jgi:hypothetical protein
MHFVDSDPFYFSQRTYICTRESDYKHSTGTCTRHYTHARSTHHAHTHVSAALIDLTEERRADPAGFGLLAPLVTRNFFNVLPSP